jgi:membrane associated rhomboid family serine protease
MNQYQMSAPPLTKINKVILITTGVCFLFYSILKAVGAFNLVSLLGLSASGLMSGFIFQLVTYPFMEVQLMGFIFNSLVVWFIGSELEAQWGRRVYLRFLLINLLVVGLLFVLVNTVFFYGTAFYSTPLHGLTGINFAMLMAYALLYPDRQMSLMMIFPMRARTFCWILAGIEVYMALFSGMAASWAHLLAMGVTYLVIKFQNRPLLNKVLHAQFEKKKRSKNHLYVVKDEDQKPPKFWQ